MRLNLGIILMFLAAAMSISCRSEKPAPSAPIPEISIEPQEADFGEVRQGETAHVALTVTNIGAVNAILGEIQSTCPCITGRLDRNYLVPGESTRAVISMATEDRPGEIREKVMLPIDDLQRAYQYVTFHGTVRPGLLVTPDNHRLTRAGACKEREYRTTLRNLSDAEITVQSVRSSSENIRVRIDENLPAAIKPGGEIVVHLFAAPWKEGSALGGSVTVETMGDMRAVHTISLFEDPTAPVVFSDCQTAITSYSTSPSK